MEHEGAFEVSPRLSNPIYALPFELLGAVFSHISEDPLDLRYALLVCRRWHNAIVHHANLWSNITLGYTFLTRFRGARLPDGDAFVRLCLSRSSPLPLHISVHDPDCAPLYRNTISNTDAALSDECFALVAHVLDGNSKGPENLSQRCRSLSWFFYRRSRELNLVARTFTSASLPALEYLAIKNLLVHDGIPVIRFPRLPRLKEVTLVDHSESCTPPFFHDDDFAKAESLIFTNTSKWMDYDVACVRRFRSIRTLVLKDSSHFGVRSYGVTLAGYLKPAEFPLLETLTLSGRIPYQVLKPIRTPGLREMAIEAETVRGWHSLVATNLMHLVPSLERFYLSLCEQRHTASWVEEVEQLVAEAPSLVNVYVSPWMVQRLNGKEWRTGLHVTV